MSATPEQRRCSNQRYLTDGEITGDDDNTYVLGSSTHVDGCARIARKLIGSSSPAAMEDDGGCVVVRRRPSVTICSGVVLYSFVVTYQS